MMAREDKKIAIIGIALNIPKAKSLNELFKNLVIKKELISEFPSEKRLNDIYEYQSLNSEVESLKVKKAAFIDDISLFDANFFNISPNEAKLMDPHQRLFLEVAYSAIEDSGEINNKNMGVYLGFASEFSNITYQKMIMDTSNIDMIQDSFSGNLPAIMPSRISYFLNLQGPSLLVDTSCSSSLTALHLAIQGIKNGDCDSAVVGGVNLFTMPLNNEVVGGVGIVSSEGISKTFDECCDGVSQGEGVVAIVVKELNSAIKDKNHIYGVIEGSGVNQNGKSIGITAPNSKAQINLLEKVWKENNIDPNEISYVEAHGTATKLGDPTEFNSLKKAFEKFTDKKQFCGIGSIKTNYGHTISSAGLLSVIKVCLQLKYHLLLPSLYFSYPNKKINFVDSPFYLIDETQKWESKKRIASINSFGIGGSNAHVVISEFKKDVRDSKEKLEQKLYFPISAKSKESLVSVCREYLVFLEENKNINLFDFSYTLANCKAHLKFKVIVVCGSCEELMKSLLDIIENRFERNTSIYHNFSLLEQSFEDTRQLQDGIVKSYLENKEFKIIFKEFKGKVIHVPHYPFNSIRYWIDPSLSITKLNQTLKIYVEEWKTVPLQRKIYDKNIPVFEINSNKILYYEKMDTINCEPIEINEFTDLENKCFGIEDELVISISSIQRDGFEDYLFERLNDLFKFIEQKDIIRKVYILNISKDTEIDNVDLLLMSYIKTLMWEFPRIKVKVGKVNGFYKSKKEIISYLNGNNSRFSILRNNSVKIPVFHEKIVKIDNNSNNSKVHIIAGFGSIGEKILRKNFDLDKNFICICRNHKSKHDDLMMEAKQRKTKVNFIYCDINNKIELKRELDKLLSKNEMIDVYFMAVNNTLIELNNLDLGKFKSNVESKIEGVNNLNDVLNEYCINNFILFSSVMTLISGKGNFTYTFSNMYLNNFADIHNGGDTHYISVMWPEWKDTVSNSDSYDESKSLYKKIGDSDAFKYLDLLKKCNISSCIVGSLNYESDLMKIKDYLPINFKDEINNDSVQKLKTSDNENLSLLDKIIAAISKVLGYNKITKEDNFFEIGGDSIKAVRISSELSSMGVHIEPSDIMKYQNSEEIEKFLLEKDDSNGK